MHEDGAACRPFWPKQARPDIAQPARPPWCIGGCEGRQHQCQRFSAGGAGFLEHSELVNLGPSVSAWLEQALELQGGRGRRLLAKTVLVGGTLHRAATIGRGQPHCAGALATSGASTGTCSPPEGCLGCGLPGQRCRGRCPLAYASRCSGTGWQLRRACRAQRTLQHERACTGKPGQLTASAKQHQQRLVFSRPPRRVAALQRVCPHSPCISLPPHLGWPAEG